MTTPYAAFVAAAGQRDFVVPFPYLSKSHVMAYVNGALQALAPWPGNGQLRLLIPAPSGAFVQIERVTPLDGPLVEFQNGNVLTSEDLNTAVLQLLYKQQELTAKYDRTIDDAKDRLADLGGIEIPSSAVWDTLVQRVLEMETVNSLLGRLGELDQNATAIMQEAQNRAAALAAATAALEARSDALFADAMALLEEQRGDSEAAVAGVSQRVTVVENEQSALASQLTTVAALAENAAAAVIEQDTAGVSDLDAIAASLLSVTANYGMAKAEFRQQLSLRADETSAQAQLISELEASLGAAEASIQAEQLSRVEADEALADQITTVNASVGNTSAMILAEQAARVAGDAALAEQISLLVVGTEEDGAAAIMQEQTARAAADDALAADITALTADLGAASAAILAEQTARATAVGALSTQISGLTANYNSVSAAVVAEQAARASADGALTTQINGLVTSVANAQAAITAEQTARASADTALSNQITGLTATVNGHTAAIASEQTARVAADTALANSVSALQVDMGNAEAAIGTEQTARASADAALASEVSLLSTTVGANTAAVATTQSAVNGLKARYSVVLNVNGHITGFVQNNDGTSGDFTVVANKFSIVDPNGGSPFTPFEVVNGVVRIKEASIGSLSVGKLTSGALTAPVTQNADWTIGTGKIIWNNGAYMKVSGVGFGSSGQFLEWFGPTMPIHLCNEANATQYLRTDGSAYFGGALLAGTLRNAVSASIVQVGAESLLGPFTSNGGGISITLSVSLIRIGQVNSGGAGGNTGSISVRLECKTGANEPWFPIGGDLVVPINGSWTAPIPAQGGDPAIPGDYRQEANGSMTTGWGPPSISTAYLRARVISRNIPDPPYGQSYTESVPLSAGASIVAIEQ